MPNNKSQIWIPEHLVKFAIREGLFSTRPQLNCMLHPDGNLMAVLQDDSFEGYLQSDIDEGPRIHRLLPLAAGKFMQGKSIQI